MFWAILVCILRPLQFTLFGHLSLYLRSCQFTLLSSQGHSSLLCIFGNSSFAFIYILQIYIYIHYRSSQFFFRDNPVYISGHSSLFLWPLFTLLCNPGQFLKPSWLRFGPSQYILSAILEFTLGSSQFVPIGPFWLTLFSSSQLSLGPFLFTFRAIPVYTFGSSGLFYLTLYFRPFFQVISVFILGHPNLLFGSTQFVLRAILVYTEFVFRAI